MFKTVFFEISGVCNAKCKYCVNGGENSISGAHHRKEGRLIDIQEFYRAITYMYDNHIIGDLSLVRLFNWGEPFLYPNLKKVISILNDKNISFGFSTNASHPVYFDKDTNLSGMKEIYFSMPGFSQQSYDRIHGFNFEQIKLNIADIVKNLRENGFNGTTKILYHLYRFNLGEVDNAKDFASELNIGIAAFGAYFNGLTMFKDYLTGKLDVSVLKVAHSELFTNYIDEQSLARPESYVCPQLEFLTIDEYCNVLTCCAVDRSSASYSIGNLFKMSLDEINEKRLKQHGCLECRQLGIDFLGDNPMPESWLIAKSH